MSFRELDRVLRLEVHARKLDGKLVFRIWDGREGRNYYATADLTQDDAVTNLIRLEKQVGGRPVTKEKAKARVENAARNGFESVFSTSGELNDPWYFAGTVIRRGI